MPRLPVRARDALLAAAVGLLGLASVLWLSRLLAERLLREQLDAGSRTAASATAALLEQADLALERIGQGWDGGCDAAAAARLRDAALVGLGATEALLLDASGTTACTPAGPVRLEPSGRASPPGEEVAAAGSPAPGIRLRRRLPAGWGEVALPLSFVTRSLGFLEGTPGIRVRLVGTGGTAVPLHGSREEGEAPPARVLGRALPRHAISVEATASEAAVRASRQRTLPLGLLLGLPFGVGLAALVLLARRASLTPERQLFLALERGELDVRYLPLVDARTGRCTGAEVLLRWDHPSLGRLRPDTFVPLAEETGLILPITEWLLRRVASDFPGALPDPSSFHLSVNLSGAHLRSPGTVEAIRRAVAGTALSPRQLVFEVTERDLVQDESAQHVLAGLEEWGASLALDDFGTGFSNLSALQRFRVEYLKLDRSLLSGIGRGGLADTVLDSVVDLASRLEMAVVAEGVETRDQLEALGKRGVHLCQGWYFSRPVPFDELARLATRGFAGEETGPEGGPGAHHARP